MFGTPQNQGGGVVCYNWTTVSGGSTPCITGPTYYTIGQIATVVFGDGSGADCGSAINAVCDVWNMYTGGFTTDTIPDQMYTTYNTAFGSNVCGGGLVAFPSNYLLHCDPRFDSQAQGGEFSTSGQLAAALFNQAAVTAAQGVMTIPIYVPLVSFGANNGYSYQGKSISTSLVSQKGNGWEAGTPGTYFSLLNMRQIPGYTGTAPGCRNPTTGVHQIECVRAGMSQDTDFLNIFTGDTVWDFSIMNQVYDSMLALVPGTGGFSSLSNTTPEQFIDWMTISHADSFNPKEITCVGKPVNTIPLCVQGTTTQTWTLRPDLKWHDGATVTAADVAYSILADRDVPSSLLGSFVANVATDTCTGTVTAIGACSGTLQAIYGARGLGCPVMLGATNLDGTPVSVIPCQATIILGSGAGVTCPAPCNVVQVKLQGQSVLFDSNIGGIPILPQHIWQNGVNGMPGCGIMPLPAGGGVCSIPGLDSMAAGNFIGSGPMVCVSSTGHIGGPCTSTGTQVTQSGGTVLLKAFSGYMRGPTTQPQNSYQKFSWSDRNNEGGVGIDDLANAAVDLCISGTLGSSTCPADGYWGNPVITGSTPGKVTAAVLATIALYFGISLTHPFSPAQVTNLDPNLDYYDYTGLGGGVYFGCPATSATSTSFTCYTDSPPSGGESLAVTDTNLNPIAGASCSETRNSSVPDPLNPTPGYLQGVWTCTSTGSLPSAFKLVYVPGTGAAASPFGVSNMPYYIFGH
jgi:ABC-type transport system substrate-binding protein